MFEPLSNFYLLFCLNIISVKFVVFIAIYKVKNEIHEMRNVSSLSSLSMKSKFVTFANVCAKKHLVMHIRDRKNAENEVGKNIFVCETKTKYFLAYCPLRSSRFTNSCRSFFSSRTLVAKVLNHSDLNGQNFVSLHY